MALVDALIGALEAQLARSEQADGWSLESLVEQAGVGVASFYEYFSNKDSLLGAFIGRLNSRNFEVLLTRVDERRYESLEETVAHVAKAIVDIYFASPRTTRAAIVTVGRLNLLGPIHTERDRFALELARRGRPFLQGPRRRSSSGRCSSSPTARWGSSSRTSCESGTWTSLRTPTSSLR